MLLLDLSSGDGRPIYGQIADRVKFAVAGGVIRPGDLVPSVRELSKQLVVNPNTVARAYRDLQAEGLLESVRGMGLQVAEGAVERCRAARRELVRQRLRRAIEEARQSNLDPDEIEAILREEWARGKTQRPRGGMALAGVGSVAGSPPEIVRSAESAEGGAG
jgi:GntR family transcriptional regulator